MRAFCIASQFSPAKWSAEPSTHGYDCSDAVVLRSKRGIMCCAKRCLARADLLEQRIDVPLEFRRQHRHRKSFARTAAPA
jgi:hypothetical protein